MGNAGNTSLGFMGPQHLAYGFDPKKVVLRLTDKNWRRKAVMRQGRQGLFYAWVQKGTREESGKRKAVYVVSVECLEGKGGRDFGCRFDTLEDALRYANGEDGSAFSLRTHAVGPFAVVEDDEAPVASKTAPTVFSVMGMGHKVQIPEPEGSEGRRSKDGKVALEPDYYGDFLTVVLMSILKIAPEMSNHIYRFGFTLHPDVKTRLRLGQTLPDKIAIRVYKEGDQLAARFHMFPNQPRSRGLIRAARVEDPGKVARDKGRPVVRKVAPKSKVGK